jgi:hypothetical protein
MFILNEMKSSQILVVRFCFMLNLFVGLLAHAGVAEDISTPKYSDVRFSKNSIALITEREAYLFDRQLGFSKPVNVTLPADFLASTLPQMEQEQVKSKSSEIISVMTWKTSKGIKLQQTDGYCGEGAEEYHSLIYDGEKIPTYLPGCESISDVEVVENQLWLGSYEQHEYGFGAGSGVRVVSLKSKKLIAAFSPKQKSMASYVMPLIFDAETGKLSAGKKSVSGRANGGKTIQRSKGQLADGFVHFIRYDQATQDVWVLTKTALHRISKEKVIDRWYLSEQFNKDGQVSLFASLKPQKSNPWAIMVRHTKLKNTESIGKLLNQSPSLVKRLTYAYDEAGEHFSIDGKPAGAVMRDYDLNTSNGVQDLINRLTSK